MYLQRARCIMITKICIYIANGIVIWTIGCVWYLIQLIAQYKHKDPWVIITPLSNWMVFYFLEIHVIYINPLVLWKKETQIEAAQSEQEQLNSDEVELSQSDIMKLNTNILSIQTVSL